MMKAHFFHKWCVAKADAINAIFSSLVLGAINKLKAWSCSYQNMGPAESEGKWDPTPG